MAIGASLFVSILAIGPITGSAINPAVWVGTVSSAAYCGDVQLDNWWAYWVAHSAAGLWGGFWFKLMYECDEADGQTSTAGADKFSHQQVSTVDADGDCEAEQIQLSPMGTR